MPGNRKNMQLADFELDDQGATWTCKQVSIRTGQQPWMSLVVTAN